MNEKELLEKLRETADQITPPDSLHPDSIERMLREPARKNHRISVFRIGGLAAAFAAVIIGSWQAGRLSAENSAAIQRSPVTADIPETAVHKENGAAIVTDTERNEASATPETAVPAEENRSPAFSGSESQGDGGTALTSEEEAAVPITASLEPAGSYETVYNALFERFGSYGTYRYGLDAGMGDGVAVDEVADAVAETAFEAGSAQAIAGNSYSTTNVQEIGVDEGDFVKTDGRYLYVLRRSGSLVILSADAGSMATVSTLTVPTDESVQEMYLDGDRLSFITSYYKSEMDTSTENVISYRSGMCTKLYTYDIADRAEPKLLGTTEQDGSFSQSRKNGDYLYIFSSYSPLVMDTYGESEIVPITSRGPVDASEVYLPESLSYSSYLVATSINIQDPGKIVDQKAVVSAPSSFYASKENIYIANETWDSSNTRTDLMKLHYEDGVITGVAAGTVEGYLNDSFSLNEYKGYLRVVTTSYDEDYNESNGLYIFDPNMRMTGAIRDLAPDETVRSARFLGDTGYFVTFRQTDPLFSVDLSDPEDPQILGYLKVSGFSSYLHFYSDTLLLGLGYEADETTGSTTGLKLSMFDVSDPANVTEVSKLVFPGITWCDSFDDYKSILMDPQKNIFGFSCSDRYLVFSYDPEQGFVREFTYDSFNDILDGCDSGYEYGTVIRGLYINDTFYLVRPGVVSAFDMADNYRQIGRLLL